VRKLLPWRARPGKRERQWDRVASGQPANARALAPTTARIVLITSDRSAGFGVRRGWLADNPVDKLEPAESGTGRRSGRGADYRDVGEAFQAAVRESVVTAPGRLSLHSLRHAFASLLIAKGLNVVYVSRQLGHATPPSPSAPTPTSSNAPTTR
jgi:integrase